jgi:hypothetical protein
VVSCRGPHRLLHERQSRMVDVDGNGLELLTDGANDFDPV